MCISRTQQPDINHATIAVKATQMVEKLSEDNRNLRQELEKYLKKMSKIQKVSGHYKSSHVLVFSKI